MHIIGLTSGFPSISSSLNYAKALNPSSSSTASSICENYSKMLPKLDPLEMYKIEELLIKFNNIFESLVENECEISKIYPLVIPCPNRLKFVYQNGDYSINYLCSEKFEEIEKNLTKEERVPIQRDLYLMIKITETPLDKMDFDHEKMKELNYYFMAYWISFPIKSFVNKEKKVFYLLAAVFIRINVHHYNFIGLADSYSQASCIDLNMNYDRYIAKKDSRFTRDSFLFKHEQAFFNSVKPKKLELYQMKYNLGTVATNNLRTFLKKMQCEFSRVWIPIRWVGDGSSSCGSVFSGKFHFFMNISFPY